MDDHDILDYTLLYDNVGIDPSHIVRHGGTVVPPTKMQARSIAQIFNQQLNPTTMMTVGEQAAVATHILAKSSTGCNVVTGQEIVVALPILTSQLYDSYGILIPGGPTPGTAFRLGYTGNGSPLALYGLSTDNGRDGQLPFVTDFVVGDGLKKIEYGLYQWTDSNGVVHPKKTSADPTVKKPQISVNANPAHFSFDPTTGQMDILADGTSGAYIPGTNIQFVPGAAPVAGPDVNMVSGGALSDGAYEWATAERYHIDGADVLTALSPASLGLAAESYHEAYLTIASRSNPKVTAIVLFRNTQADKETFRQAQEVTTGLDAPQVIADGIADDVLGDPHGSNQTKIATTDVLTLTNQTTTPTTPIASKGILYAKAVSGKAHPWWMEEDGSEHDLLAGGGSNYCYVRAGSATMNRLGRNVVTWPVNQLASFTEIRDDSAMFDPASPTIVTITAAGVYRVEIAFALESQPISGIGASGSNLEPDPQVCMLVNGSFTDLAWLTNLPGLDQPSDTTGGVSYTDTISLTLPFALNDQISVQMTTGNSWYSLEWSSVVLTVTQVK